MPIRVVQLGSPRARNEGTRLGTVRRPPRGVKKEDYARLDYYDAWLPELAPSAGLFSWMMAAPITDARWETYARRYRREMAQPPARNVIAALARLSQDANFSVGCYCEDESRCHRSLLRGLLQDAGASFASRRDRH